jgi:rubredoxin
MACPHEPARRSIRNPRLASWRRMPRTRVCPTCGDPLTFEILDDERFLVAWSCLDCGLVRATEPT